MGAKRVFSLFISFFIKNLRESTAYKLDFFVGISAHLIMQTCNVLFINLLFSNISFLHGWNYYQCIALYGYGLIPFGLEELFLHNIWQLPDRYIRQGGLDKLLLRPIHPLFAITVDGVSLHGFIIAICGLILFCYSGMQLKITLSVFQIIGFIIFSISGMFICFSITAFVAILSIWFTEIMSAMVLVNSFSQFIRYPLHIFPMAVKISLTVIIPYAFTSYFPIGYLLSIPGFTLWAWSTPFISMLLLYLVNKFFFYALKYYKSAGG